MRRPAVIVVLLLACAVQSALGATAKSGRPFPAPRAPGPRQVQALSSASHALIELDRLRAREAVPALRLSGGVLVSGRLDIWQLPTAAAQRLVPRLRRAGLVRTVEPDRQVSFPLDHLGRSDPLIPGEWWIAAVGADQVEPPGPGMPVTLIDSGVDASHPEFAGRPDLNLLNEQTLDGPDEDHGTATASVVGAPANGIGLVGVFPNAVLNVWDTTLSDADIIAGIEAALDRGPSVINMSFGGSEYNRLFEEEVLLAFGAGSIVVAAAGNEFEEGNPIEFPASFNHVLTVAASDPQNAPTSFSNANLAVDLAAPGQAIPVAVPVGLDPDGDGYAIYDGTSFAAPLVAGATAWVWTVRPELHNTQMFDLIRFSAKDIAGPGYDVDTGYGLLDIPAALSREPPASDLQEPNDDVYQITANGLFEQATRPVTGPGRPRASFEARLDITEDPEDVYRVWLPGKRSVTATVRGNENVDVELWAPGTPTVFVKGKQRRKYLLDGSYRTGKKPDSVSLVNNARKGTFVYLDVYLPRNGPLDASYVVEIGTTKTR